jgi:ribulose-5-phosphate 4-epimerase/fuculose-1-phosphate aldolase
VIDEGVIKFRSEWQRCGPLDYPEIDLLVRWRRPLYAAGLIGQYDEIEIGYGNLSIRLSGGRQFIISGTQTGHLADLDARHFALVTDYDIAGNRLTSTGASEASSESLTHAMLYELDRDTRAVVHVHAPEPWARLAGELPTTRADVAYGTPAMAREFSRLYAESAFPECGVAVMAGHDDGIISIGSSLEEACQRILATTSRAGNSREKGR